MDIRVDDQSEQKGFVQRAAERVFRSRRRVATAAVVLLALWLALRVVSGPNGWMAYYKKRTENQQLQQEVDRLQRENEDLERRVKALQSDPQAIEREAREGLGYARPGEMIYVIPEHKTPVVQQQQTGVAQKKP